jgi:peptide/nickel transport system substrate-binding protein
LVVSQRSEPKTLNPVAALDFGSREIIGLLSADLIHVDRVTFQPAPALARRWDVSKDGKLYTVHLRRGLRFSDGRPFDADDVLFTFRVHLDERLRSPQRELLIIGGRPIAIRKLDACTVEFELARAHPAAERLFDSIAILPRHLLEKRFEQGTLAQAWGLTASPSEIAGLGPFRLKQYVPGERLLLERNPYYWKVDRSSNRLPYLDEIAVVFTGSEDGQLLRFLAGETVILDGIGADNFAVLGEQQRRRGFRLHDLGPGLEYTFLLLNQNDLGKRDLPSVREKQTWFRDVAFRQAVSAAIDRDAVVRLVYRGLASPLWAHVTGGNKPWVDATIPRPPRSLERARQLLRGAGFSWNARGELLDASKKKVSFSILTSAGNTQRNRIATIIQDDLKQVGMAVSVVSLEFRAMLDRVMSTYDYDAAVMTLASGDTDPNSEMNVWTTAGSTHLWNLAGGAARAWEREIDDLMRRQLVSLRYEERKRLYDRVQHLVAINLPVICIVSPHVLAGASERVGNFRPSILRPYGLWNADELYLRR